MAMAELPYTWRTLSPSSGSLTPESISNGPEALLEGLGNRTENYSSSVSALATIVFFGCFILVTLFVNYDLNYVICYREEI